MEEFPRFRRYLGLPRYEYSATDTHPATAAETGRLRLIQVAGKYGPVTPYSVDVPTNNEVHTIGAPVYCAPEVTLQVHTMGQQLPKYDLLIPPLSQAFCPYRQILPYRQQRPYHIIYLSSRTTPLRT